MKKKKSKNKVNKARRERETIRDYLIRHGISKDVLVKRTKLSNVVVNGKTMSCAERNNLILFMYKKNYEKKWIAQAFNIPFKTVEQIIYKKGK
jgi:hypothetical protein